MEIPKGFLEFEDQDCPPPGEIKGWEASMINEGCESQTSSIPKVEYSLIYSIIRYDPIISSLYFFGGGRE